MQPKNCSQRSEAQAGMHDFSLMPRSQLSLPHSISLCYLLKVMCRRMLSSFPATGVDKYFCTC